MYGKKIMAMAAGVILAVGAAGCGTEKQDDTTAILKKHRTLCQNWKVYPWIQKRKLSWKMVLNQEQ